MLLAVNFYTNEERSRGSRTLQRCLEIREFIGMKLMSSSVIGQFLSYGATT